VIGAIEGANAIEGACPAKRIVVAVVKDLEANGGAGSFVSVLRPVTGSV
jgi:hypothetical protein